MGGAFDLDRPWVKRRVQDYVHSSVGLDVDWGSARVSVLRGAEVEDLVVLSSAEDRRITPSYLRARHATARWSPSSLFGDGPRVERIELAGVAVTAVVDERGSTWERVRSWLRSPGPHQLLATPPYTRRLDATDVSVAILSTDEHRIVDTIDLRGLAVALAAKPDAGAWQVLGTIGTPEAPLDLDLSREHEGAPPTSARVKLALSADLSSSTLTVASRLHVVTQSFVPRVEDGEWQARATARFEPSAKRTVIVFEQVSAAAGAGTAEAELELPDEGAPIVRHASGDVDVTRVLAWLPSGLVPLVADRARLRYRVSSAVLEPTPRLAEGGTVQIEAELSNAKLRTHDASVEVDRAQLALEGCPSASGLSLRGVQQLDGVRADLSGAQLDANELSIDVDGERGGGGALEGRLLVRFDRLKQKLAGVVARARGGRAEARFERGDRLAVSANLASLEVRGPDVRVLADAVYFESRSPLAELASYRGALEANANRVQIFTGDASEPVVVPFRAAIDAVKYRDAIDYALRADTPRVALRSKGRLERIASGAPLLRQESSIDVEGPSYRGVSARSLSVEIRGEGTLTHQEAVLRVHAPELAIEGLPTTDNTMNLVATVDREPWSVRVEGDLDGYARAKVSASASFDRDARALVFDIDGVASNLVPITPLTDFDLARLELGLATRGRLAGVIASIDPREGIALEPDPWRTAAIEGSADLRVSKLRWAPASRNIALAMPSFVWHGDMRVEGTRRTLHGRAEVDSVRLALGAHEIDLAGLSDDANLTVTGDLRNPTIDLTQRGTIRTVAQDYVVEYPVGDVTVALSAGRGRDGLLRVTNLFVHNGRGGTTLVGEGSLDPEGRRRHLALTTTAVQDLAPLSVFPDRFTGRGKVVIGATVESPDLSLFRTQFDVKVEQAQLRVPRAHIEAEGINGEIPIRIVFDVDHGDVALSRKFAPSPFARLGLTDRHPLLRRRGLVSIGRFTTPRVSIAPFIGKVSIDQNVVALDQFELGIRGGWLTGDCVLDWDGLASKLEAHLRASGVRSSHGEPFDGNIALVVGARDRTIEGRAEITQMGAQHLLDLLDWEDPLHADAAMNRVRSALAWGHPKRVSAVFGNGFANAEIELGGLAKFLSVPSLHGVPTGPLVDRLVEVALDGEGVP